MATESGTYISDLDAAKPGPSEAASEGDDHLRLIKSFIKATFPNVSGAMTCTHTELNVLDGIPATLTATELGYVDGVTSAIQTQLTALASVTQNSDPAAAGTTYTLALTDVNKHLLKTGTDAETWTIPPNSSVAFPTGTTVTFVNNAASAITVARGSGVALIWAGNGADANRTLAVYGLATILKIGTDTWYISGVGLS